MNSPKKKLPETRSREEFQQAPVEIQQLIKAVLVEERQVMHMKHRPDIHKNILKHVRDLIQ